jgi:type I pantothenate kinase
VNLTFELAVEGIAARVPRVDGMVVCVGVSGPVAAGKSAFAHALASVLGAGRTVEVLSTDGFLLPNAELGRRGILGRKGYPETYDRESLRDAVARLRDGESVVVPDYSHETYDVVPEARVVGPCDVLVVEGLHVQTQLRELLDVSVFVDADTSLLEEWYVARFQGLLEEGRNDPSSFFASMSSLSPADADSLARQVWHDVNLPNCVEHVAAERTVADIVVIKGPEHCVLGVEIQRHELGLDSEGGFGGERT